MCMCMCMCMRMCMCMCMCLGVHRPCIDHAQTMHPRLTSCQACTALQRIHCLALPPRHLPRLATLCGSLPRLTTLHLADLLLASPAAVAALAAAIAAAPALRDLFLPRLNVPSRVFEGARLGPPQPRSSCLLRVIRLALDGSTPLMAQ